MNQNSVPCIFLHFMFHSLQQRQKLASNLFLLWDEYDSLNPTKDTCYLFIDGWNSGGTKNLFLRGPCIKFFIVCMKSKIPVMYCTS